MQFTMQYTVKLTRCKAAIKRNNVKNVKSYRVLLCRVVKIFWVVVRVLLGSHYGILVGCVGLLGHSRWLSEFSLWLLECS